MNLEVVFDLFCFSSLLFTRCLAFDSNMEFCQNSTVSGKGKLYASSKAEKNITTRTPDHQK